MARLNIEVPANLIKYFPTFAKYLGQKAPTAAAPKKPKKESKKDTKPKLPMVNLLPPRLALARARQNTRRGFVIVGVGVVGAGMLIWAAQSLAISQAQASLTSAQTQVGQAASAGHSLTQYTAFYNALRDRYGLRSQLEGTRIDQGSIFNLIQQAQTAGITITGITITPMSDVLTNPNGQSNTTANTKNLAANCGPISDPFANTAAAPLGCVKITGTATDRATLDQFNQALAGSDLLSNVSIGQTASSTSTSGLNGTHHGIFTGNPTNSGNTTNATVTTVINFTGTASVNASAIYTSQGAN